MPLVQIEGELEWTRVVNPEEYKGKSAWSTSIIPTRDSLDVIRDLQAEGVKNVVKKNEKNQYYVKFSRPTERKKKEKVIQTFNPPVVTDMDGNVVDGYTIGNGTKAIVTLDVYSHPVQGGGTAKAARLESIKITELVKYEGSSD